MTNKQINVYKPYQHYLDNPEIKKIVTNEMNHLIPEIVSNAKLQLENELPNQIRITTSKLPITVKRYILERAKESPQKKMSDILVDLLFDSVINETTSLEKRIKEVIEDESATQIYYLKEVLLQLNGFLLSLKKANNLD